MDTCIICLDEVQSLFALTCCDYKVDNACYKMAIGDSFKCPLCHVPIGKKEYISLFGRKAIAKFTQHAIGSLMEIPLFDNGELRLFFEVRRKIRPKMNKIADKMKDIENHLPHGTATIDLYKYNPGSITLIDLQYIRDYVRMKKSLIDLQHKSDIEKMMNRRVIPTAKCSECSDGLVINMVCHLCGQGYCDACHALSHQGECDPNTLSTYQFQVNHCRRCPKCFTFYQKGEGCDDMYCTICRTFFSYKYGHVYRYARHNPEYDRMGQRTVTDVHNDEIIIRRQHPSLLDVHKFYMRVYTVLIQDDNFEKNIFKTRKRLQLTYLDDPNNKDIQKSMVSQYELDLKRQIIVNKCASVLIEYRKQLTLLYSGELHQIPIQYERDLEAMKSLSKKCGKSVKYFRF